MPKKAPGPKAAALGAELRAIRMQSGKSMAAAGTLLGWSEAKVSRLETGNRNIDPEEVSALLAVYHVTGTERDRLMAMARTPDEESWLDRGLRGLPMDSVKLATYEAQATRITDWGLGLVPGLLQTMGYTRAYMLADGIPAEEVGVRLMARQQRQEVLRKVEYVAYLDEQLLYRPTGGTRVMREQLRRLVDLATDGDAAIHITPSKTEGHPGLNGPFMLLEFEGSPPRVHIELQRSGVFYTGDHDPQAYVDVVGRLDSLSLDVEQSLRLLREAVGAIGSET